MNANNTDSIGWIFQLSTWQGWIALLFLIFVIFAICFSKRKWKLSQTKTLFLGLFLGLSGGIIFYLITINSLNNPGWINNGEINVWEDEVFSWLSLTSAIFISSITFFIPLSIFVNVISLFSTDPKNTTPKQFYISLFSTILASMLGILFAFCFYPILKSIHFIGIPPLSSVEEPSTIINIFVYWIPSTIGILASPKFIVSIVIMGTFLGLITKNVKKNSKETGDSIEVFFINIKKIFNKGIQVTLVLLPIVVATKLPTLFLDSYGIQFSELFIFIFIIIFSMILITCFNFILVILLSFKKNNFNNSFKYQKITIIQGLKTQSLEKTLPLIRENSYLISLDKKTSYLTPSLASTMSLTASASFIPTVIVLITLINSPGANISFITFLTIFVVITCISFGIRATSDNTVVSSITATQSLGYSSNFLTTVMLPFYPLLKPFILSANISSIMFSTILASKIIKLRTKNSPLKNEFIKDFDKKYTNFSNEENDNSVTEIDIYEESAVELYNEENKTFNQINNLNLKNKENENIEEENIENLIIEDSIFSEIEIDLDDDSNERNIW